MIYKAFAKVYPLLFEEKYKNTSVLYVTHMSNVCQVIQVYRTTFFLNSQMNLHSSSPCAV